ncbi:nicotinamidase-related amidase [Rhizobium sp. BK529]|uniref:isochorismatase family protein n=1 Tax=unclassified Rhizobium TaxID=2613769 RepID=UPI001052B20F|nr:MULTISPECIES: isochorismatase family protein [unclassified Rhizobium]MBB3590753.1 nicotinamidase-related amidase [Rhizobium sp. BK529]TCS09289.1 nicotinamidase-related amidase [Rhizobium sp. BK418]
MTTALLIIDMQMVMQERLDAGRERVNGEAGENIAALIAAFRAARKPVIHIRHVDADPASALHKDAPGCRPMPCAEARDNEPVFIKSTSSAFASTELEGYLREVGITDLVVVGAVAGFCVNTTVRAGSDLGFRMSVVRDAVLGFDLPDADLSARTIFDVTMAHLKSDFAEIVETRQLVAMQPA